MDLVYVTEAVPSLRACEKLAADLAGTDSTAGVTSVVLNKMTFSVRRTGDTGMNQFIPGHLYTRYARETCYLFETDVASLADGVDPKVRTLNDQDYRAIDLRLFTIVQTVSIRR